MEDKGRGWRIPGPLGRNQYLVTLKLSPVLSTEGLKYLEWRRVLPSFLCDPRILRAIVSCILSGCLVVSGQG